MSPSHFVSTIGNHVDSTFQHTVAYNPMEHPLLMIADSTGQRSLHMVDRVTEDALASGWSVQNFRRTPYAGKSAPERSAVCHDRTEQGNALVTALTAYADMVQELVESNARQQSNDTPRRLNTLIVIEGIDQVSRADRRTVLNALCTMLHHSAALGLGILVTSSTPQIAMVKDSGVEYVDVRFDHNSFHSSYSPNDHQRVLVNQVKHRKDIAYARFTTTQHSVILRTTDVTQRQPVTTG